MPSLTPQELLARKNHRVVRTERGIAVVQRDPRELPRRLRLLLLSIDGGQTVQVYLQTLKGFGDVAELLRELLVLGLVRLSAPTETGPAPSLADRTSALDALLDDSRFNSEAAVDVLYGSTAPGSFDDLVRVARLETPDYHPPAAQPPAPVSPAKQHAQIESLFELLDAVRGERRTLRQQLEKMGRLKAAALRLKQDNRRLSRQVYALGTLCVALSAGLLVMLLRR